MSTRKHRFGIALSAALLTGCSSNPVGGSTNAAALPPAAQCVLRSPALQVGATPELTINGITYTRSHQPDAPGPLETPIPHPGPQPNGACKGNTGYRFGSGLYDTTGPIGGNAVGHADLAGMVVPSQPQNGIHMRLYARAFAIESPCNGKRVVFVSDDHAKVTPLERQEVLKTIAADPELSRYYGPHNVMLSATHTHAAPGGLDGDAAPTGSPQPLALTFAAASMSNGRFDQDNFKVVVGGIVQAIRRAHANLQVHPQTAPIRLSVGELLNANRSRDPPAYQQNSPAERARYVNQAGHEVQVDKRFLQLSFVRGTGSAAGVLNWFGVHPTTMHNHNLLISSDMSGYASLGFEKVMSTRYVPDGAALSGADNFVAAFAQTDEGNTVPDIFVFDKDLDGNDGPGQGLPYRHRLGTDDPYHFDEPGYQRGGPKAAAVFGTKLLAQALKQYGQGSALSGPVDYRLFYVDMNNIAVTDEAILSGLAYPDLPPGLYEGEKTTCASATGLSVLAGGVNGVVFGAAGFACVDDAPVPYQDEIRNHYNGLYNGSGEIIVDKQGVIQGVPFDSVSTFTAATPALCAKQRLQPEFACQREKPVLSAGVAPPVPFQLFRIGNLAVLGVPFEVATMAARRLRQTVLDALAPVGVDTVVISFANGAVGYMVTREEYSAQMFESGLNLFGPWQLAAAQQEARKLALAMANDRPAPEGPAPEASSPGDPSPITTDADAEFGKTVTGAQPTYKQGDVVDVSWVAGFPGNDLKTMSSYLFVERQNSQNSWDVVATDKDPELLFIWNRTPDPASTMSHVMRASTAQAVWTIPKNAAAGAYRIRHEGVSRASASAPPTPYTGISNPFTISEPASECP